MKIKLDENLDPRCVQLLVPCSTDVSSVKTQGLSGRSDEVIHAVCVAENRVLITFDLDFRNPLRFRCEGTGRHPGPAPFTDNAAADSSSRFANGDLPSESFTRRPALDRGTRTC